jgi:hypothetical protein
VLLDVCDVLMVDNCPDVKPDIVFDLTQDWATSGILQLPRFDYIVEVVSPLASNIRSCKTYWRGVTAALAPTGVYHGNDRRHPGESEPSRQLVGLTHTQLASRAGISYWRIVLEGKLDAMDDKLDAMEDKLNAMEDKLAMFEQSVTKQFADVHARLTTLESMIAKSAQYIEC